MCELFEFVGIVVLAGDKGNVGLLEACGLAVVETAPVVKLEWAAPDVLDVVGVKYDFEDAKAWDTEIEPVNWTIMSARLFTYKTIWIADDVLSTCRSNGLAKA